MDAEGNENENEIVLTKKTALILQMWENTAIRPLLQPDPHVSFFYLSTLSVDLVDGLEGVQVIDTRVNTDLVHDNHAGRLGTIQSIHQAC